MDPLTITSGVAALIGVGVKVGFTLKDVYDGTQIVDAKGRALGHEVESLVQVLEFMRATLEEKKMQDAFQSTGHIGNHWKNIAACIEDGQRTLEQLQAVLEKVDKTVVVLDSARKHFRIKFAADEIAMYHGQIRSYKDTMQLSIQTVIL